MNDEPVQVFASVWDALEETPVEAASLRLRSELAIAVRAAAEGWGLTPAQAAGRLGVTAAQDGRSDAWQGRQAQPGGAGRDGGAGGAGGADGGRAGCLRDGGS